MPSSHTCFLFTSSFLRDVVAMFPRVVRVLIRESLQAAARAGLVSLTIMAGLPGVAAAQVVTFSWDTKTDVALHVVDPTGEEIYFGVGRSTVADPTNPAQDSFAMQNALTNAEGAMACFIQSTGCSGLNPPVGTTLSQPSPTKLQLQIPPDGPSALGIIFAIRAPNSVDLTAAITASDKALAQALWLDATGHTVALEQLVIHTEGTITQAASFAGLAAPIPAFNAMGYALTSSGDPLIDITMTDPNGVPITFAVSAVPEPSMFLLLGCGAVAIVVIRRRGSRTSPLRPVSAWNP